MRGTFRPYGLHLNGLLAVLVLNDHDYLFFIVRNIKITYLHEDIDPRSTSAYVVHEHTKSAVTVCTVHSCARMRWH